MAGKDKLKEKADKKKKTNGSGDSGSKQGGSPGLAGLMPFVVALLTIALAYFCGPALWNMYKEFSTNSASLAVRLVRAGPAPDSFSYDAGMNITKRKFESMVQTSAVYDGRTGKQFSNFVEFADGAASSRLINRSSEEFRVMVGPSRQSLALKHFEWPASDIGARVQVADVDRPPGKGEPIILETINLSPPIFYVHNFLGEGEADKLIARSISPDNPHSLRRSTTGHKSWTQTDDDQKAEATISTRTSENGFDIDSPTAKKIKRRAWKLLRMSGDYDEAYVDGLQVLRYEQKQAYIGHHDYFPVGSSTDHNWDPSRSGTNRFATVFIYLSDVEAGGQTVFPAAESANPSPVPEAAAKLFKEGSWEARMVQDCYKRFSVQPKKGSAILFYSQKDGKLNPASLHGGCPVLNGTKWGANLWFWNGCRFRECKPHHKPSGVKIPGL